MHLLFVEDDCDLAAAMAEYLELKGCRCDFSYSGKAGIELALSESFDVIILDITLPNFSGFEVCKQLRQKGCLTPILMLTARDTAEDQLLGFDAGADDYVVKPSTMPLIWARLQALYRRQNPRQDMIQVADLKVYSKERRVIRGERELTLTPTAWRLLLLLIRCSPAVVSRADLEDFAWPDTEVSESNFNVQLHQLRKVVDKPFPLRLIHTHVGVGLSLRLGDSAHD